MKITVKICVSLLLLAVGYSAFGQIGERGIPVKGVTSFYGYSSMGRYEPETITSLNQIPATIKAKVAQHLIDRVGAEFFKKLYFHDGRVVNFTTLYERESGARDYQWVIPTYHLTFKFSDPSKGIAVYYAQVELDSVGKILQAANLPHMRKYPAKQKFFALKDAAAIAQKQGFDTQKMRTSLSYSESIDSMVWTFSQVTADNGVDIEIRHITIDAHDGKSSKPYLSHAIH